MIKFYDVNPNYANYLRQYDNRVPNITYSGNNKFVCGVVLNIGNHNYFAPISSNTSKQRTNIIIEDDNQQPLASIKFSFMFPVPDTEINVKNFGAIRQTDPAYADLLEKEYDFCKKNETKIRNKAKKIYKIGTNPSHVLYNRCCDFHLLEQKYDEWVKK